MSRVRSTPKYRYILKIQSEIWSGTKGKKYALKLNPHENRCPKRGNGIKFMAHDKQASSKSRLPSKMSVKAIKYFPYDTPDILKFVDVEKPSPKDDEVLVKIGAVSVNYGDTVARDFNHFLPQDFNMHFLIWFTA